MHPFRLTRQLLPEREVRKEIKVITEKIVAFAAPLAVYSFGSAVEGRASDHSDFDFIVIGGTKGASFASWSGTDFVSRGAKA